jgi:hypothetical protein
LTRFAQSAILAIFSLVLASASAQTLTGTVTNATTNKPGAGDEVILINLTTSMEIAANTKADNNGNFTFTTSGGPAPHLIRAVHQGVTYHQMAPPGVSTVDIKVYDAATKVTGISVTADVMRFQTDSGILQCVRLFAVNNTSSPAVTQMNDHNFEFYLPAGAKVDEVQARAPHGQPIKAEAVPQAEKNRYAIAFPLRPGETQFQLEFTLPYSGEIKIDPKLVYPAEHFVVVTPKSMDFKAASANSFETIHDPSQGESTIEVAKATKPGQPLAFTLRGEGVIPESPGDSASGPTQPPDQPQAGAQAPTQDNRPGGGLGVPIDAPDALQKYRWPILGGFTALLLFGGWVVTKRQPANSAAVASAAKPPASSSDYETVLRPTPIAPVTAPAKGTAAKSSMLLEALKEELFQLEVDRRQGKITPTEYEQAKAALDLTLDRALKRQT